MIRQASILPHPPIIIPSIGRDQLKYVKRTIDAYQKISKRFQAVKPETIVIVSPHSPIQFDKFTLNNSSTVSGDLMNFGDDRKFFLESDRDLVKEIADAAKANDIPIRLVREVELDHGILVPLYFLLNEKDVAYNPKILSISFSMLSLSDNYRFGLAIGRVLQRSKKIISFIASGDLSHRVNIDSPAGYSPVGKEFDRQIFDLVAKKNIKRILELNPDFIEEAGECGLRSIVIFFGVLSSCNYQIKPISYEAPFGVGYMVADAQFK